MRYVIARMTIECREITYRFYIAEGIKIIANNSANIVGGQTLIQSLYEIVHPKDKKEETRTADEIINHIKQGLSE